MLRYWLTYKGGFGMSGNWSWSWSEVLIRTLIWSPDPYPDLRLIFISWSCWVLDPDLRSSSWHLFWSWFWNWSLPWSWSTSWSEFQILILVMVQDPDHSFSKLSWSWSEALIQILGLIRGPDHYPNPGSSPWSWSLSELLIPWPLM